MPQSAAKTSEVRSRCSPGRETRTSGQEMTSEEQIDTLLQKATAMLGIAADQATQAMLAVQTVGRAARGDGVLALVGAATARPSFGADRRAARDPATAESSSSSGSDVEIERGRGQQVVSSSM